MFRQQPEYEGENDEGDGALLFFREDENAQLVAQIHDA
jgi:hypothetical protein